MTKSRRFLAVLLALLFLTVTAACGGAPAPEEPAPAAPAENAAPAASEAGSEAPAGAEGGETVITWLNMPAGTEDDFAEFKANLIAAFEAENPGVKVQDEIASWADGANKIMAAILAGSGPDLAHMSSWTTGQVYAANAAMDLTDVYDQFGGYDGTYVAGGRSLCEYNGRLYGVPWGGDSRAILLRTDRLEAAGIPVPPEDWTWDDFIATATALKGVDGVEFPLGLMGNADDLFFMWNAWTVARGGGAGFGVYTDDMLTATVNSEASQKALMDICDLVAVYGVTNPSVIEWDGPVTESNWLNGSISMMVGAPGVAFTSSAVESGITDVSMTRSQPTVDGSYGATLHLSVTCIMEYSQNKDAAVKFLAFLNSAANQAEFNRVAGWIPARTEAWELDADRINDRMSGTLRGMENGICIMPGNPQAINIKTIVQRTCNEVLTLAATGGEYNETVVKEALERANLDVQAELDRAAAGR